MYNEIVLIIIKAKIEGNGERLVVVDKWDMSKVGSRFLLFPNHTNSTQAKNIS